MEKKIVILDEKQPIKSKVFNKEYVYETNKKVVKGKVHVKAYKKNGQQIYDYENNNLVVIVGRSWLMQKAFDTEMDSSHPVTHLFLSWFEVGQGGTDPSDPFNPIAPNDSDVALFNRVQFGTNPAIYADGGYKKNFTSLEYPDQTTTKLVLTIDYTEVADNTPINEAGIWAANSSDPTSANEYNLFSHATFPTIMKDSTVKIDIEWYFLF